MRKREMIARLTRLERENAALKARLAPPVVVPTPKPKVVPPPKKPAKTKIVQKPSPKVAEKDKGKGEKDDSKPYHGPAGPWQGGQEGPLGTLTPAELAAQYGSAGYDDFVTPINDHDRDWKKTSERITAEGGYPAPGYM